MNTRELVEEELVYGALRREQLWRMIGIGGAGCRADGRGSAPSRCAL